MQIGVFLAKKRKEAGLSQEELAKKINKPRNFISRIECGEVKTIKNDVIVSLSKALNIPAYLFINSVDENGNSVGPHLGFNTEEESFEKEDCRELNLSNKEDNEIIRKTVEEMRLFDDETQKKILAMVELFKK